ncbi:MAG: glycosyltransferase family 1 protein [bacterium]
MKTRVIFDARWVLSKPTGIGRYIASLLPPLLRQCPDLEIHLLHRQETWPGYGLGLLAAPNLVHHVTELPCLSARQYLAIPLLARRLGASLVHHPHFDAPVLWQPVPVVATFHDVKYLLHPEFFPRGSALLKRFTMKRLFAMTGRRAAAVITVSQNTAAEVEGLFGARPGGYRVVHLAADPVFTRSSDEEIAVWRRKHNISRKFVLAVGERRPHKNLVTLIRAFAASASSTTHDLVIAGQRCQGYDLPERTAHQLGVESKVHFLDSLSDAELPPAYSAAGIAASVSLHEGFGLPILEAMACGAPVIVATTTAAGEVAGNAALRVEPSQEAAIASGIDSLSRDSALRGVLIERGLARCREFTWEHTAAKTIAVYRECIGEGRQ